MRVHSTVRKLRCLQLVSDTQCALLLFQLAKGNQIILLHKLLIALEAFGEFDNDFNLHGVVLCGSFAKINKKQNYNAEDLK